MQFFKMNGRENTSYKLFHESYMSNNKGSTIWECLFLIVPYPILIYASSVIVRSCSLPRLSLKAFLIEFSILIIPLTFNFTLLNSYNHIVCYCYLAGLLYSVFQTLQKRSKNFIKIIFTLVLPNEKRAYITYFRAICSLLTAFCILAVDFTIFPRRFSKTETYGFGLMDTGVGFYVVANGLVAKPNIEEHFVKSIKSTLPIVLLGIIRWFSLNALDYQQHISEYGLFWNFFFTLAVVKLTCPILLSYFPKRAGWISFILLFAHQTALSNGIEAWVLSDSPRDGFLSANREGLVSLPGYLSLYFAAVQIGKTLSRENIDSQADLFAALKTFIASGIFFILTLGLRPHFDVSRRLISATYVTWILAFTFLLIGICIIIEISVRIFIFVEGNARNDNVVPIIIDAVNYNGLFFFVLANLFTGFVNITLKTLTVDNTQSILILLIYMLFLCYVVSFMYRYRIRIKL